MTTKSKKYKVLLKAVALLLLALLAIWALRVFFHIGDNYYTEDAQIEEYVNPISTKVAGYLQEIRFDEHAKVRQGDTLAIIDDREYKIQLLQAEAALKQAQAGETVVRSDVDLSENATTVSQANIDELKARLENQRKNLERYANLLKADVIPQFEFDQAQTEYEAMKARYASLLRQKQSTQLNTKTVSDKVALSEADIMKAQAAVDFARLNLSYCYILAPYDGIMGRRKIADGQLVQAGQTLTTIVESGEKWVTANYTESQIEGIHIGDQMHLAVDAIKGKVFTGEVVAISGATGSRYSAAPVDNSTGNFVKVQQRIPVRIKFLDKVSELEDLRAGMNVQVTKK